MKATSTTSTASGTKGERKIPEQEDNRCKYGTQEQMKESSDGTDVGVS